MKINRKPSPSKLVARFDAELRDLLLADLKAFKAQHTRRDNQQKQHLSAA